MTIPAVLVSDLPVVSVKQMAEVDRIMIEEIGISLLQMMENAGRNIAELAWGSSTWRWSSMSIAAVSWGGP